jgi:hypothetical protein
VKLYELQVDGYHTPLSSEQIADLFRARRLRKGDPCRESGTSRWRTLDEIFPLLKYDSAPLIPMRVHEANLSMFDGCDTPSTRPAPTSALKAGWICFGLGLSIAWFFPIGNVFFTVAIVTAVVAMCTHEVNGGLALLISSFCGVGLCAVVFFTLVLGTVAITAAPAIKKLDNELKQSHLQQQQAVAQLHSSIQQAQQAFFNVTTPAPRFPRSPSSQIPAQQNSALAQSRDGLARNEAIRQAERQRDQINAKEQRIAQLQKAIESQETVIRQIRERGGDESYFVKQRDEFIREKWDLQR